MNTDEVRDDPSSARLTRGRAPRGAIAVAALAAAGLLIAGCGSGTQPAADEAPDEEATAEPVVEEQPFTEGFFYGDFDLEIALFAGATTEDFCNDEEPTTTSTVTTSADGTVDIEVDPVTWPLYLYDTPLGGPELIDEACEAMFDDDPDTVPLQPYATGEGEVRATVQIAPDGTVHAVNSSTGTVSSPDGMSWMVRGSADLQIVDDVPVGDPADFQGLEVEPADG